MLDSDSNGTNLKTAAPTLRRNLLTIALVLAVLGAGNVFFAQHKGKVYLDLLLSEPSANDSIPNIAEFSASIRSRYAHISRESESFNKTRARIEFYALVEKGGKALVALAALLILVALWVFREGQAPIKSQRAE